MRLEGGERKEKLVVPQEVMILYVSGTMEKLQEFNSGGIFVFHSFLITVILRLPNPYLISQ